MTRRSSRTVPAVVMALVLLAASILLVVVVTQSLLEQGNTPPMASLLELAANTTWSEPRALAVGAILVLAGMTALGFGLVPGRPTVLPLAATDSDLSIPAGISRRSLRSVVKRAAAGVVGLRRVRAAVGRRRIIVRGRAGRPDLARLREQVCQAVDQALLEIPLEHRPAVMVRLASSKARR